jgi:hypothetical protein
MMTKSILALTLALGLSAGLTTLARADQTAAAPSPTSQQMAGWQQEPSTANAAVNAYDHNVNPNATVHSTGIYDQSDLYRDANGNPLPGDAEMAGVGASN